MSPTAAAWIVYILISFPFSWAARKMVARLATADVLDLCDMCRDYRRRLSSSFGLPDAALAMVFIVVGFIWPVLAFYSIRRFVTRKPKHSCERARAERLAGEA